jgi:hypothetical protein
MDGTARAHPSHYDALGLTPAASEGDIARAFAMKMNAFRWHPAGAAAHVWIAYETLRDRIKRADYDRSLGLAPQRQRSWSMAVVQPQWTPFIASAREETAERSPSETGRAPEPQVEASTPREPAVDPRLESIAATVRELAKPVDKRGASGPPPRRLPERTVEPNLEPLIHEMLTVRQAEKQELRPVEHGPLEWKRPVQVVGGLILAAGLLGAILGLSARDKADSAEAAPARASIHGVAKKQAAIAVPSADPLDAKTVPHLEQSDRLFSSRPMPTPSRHSSRPVAGQKSAQDASSEIPETVSEVDSAAPGQPAADPLAPQPAAAKLPLSNAVIARTIDRIGYRCGEVASTATIEGAAPGTFKVICSSGQTYQATPLHGRYRFRRSGRG